MIAGNATPSTQLGNELTTLRGLSDGARAQALQRIAPNTNVAMASVSNQVVQGGFSEIGGRIGAIRGFQTSGSVATGVSTGEDYEEGSAWDSFATPNSFWGQVYGFKGRQDSDAGYAGYESLSKNVMVGYDVIPAQDWIVGVALGYADTDVDMGDFRDGDKTTINSYQASLYGSYAFEGDWALDVVASYARHEYDAARNTSSDVANADFGANHYGLRADVSRSYAAPYDVTLIPKAGLEWTTLKQEGYQEKDSVFAQSFESTTTHRLNSNISVEARKNFETDAYTYTPYVNLGWKHQFKTDGVNSSSRFVGGGDAFTTQGQATQRNSLSVKAGVELYTQDQLSFDLGFDGDFAEKYQGYGAKIKAKWTF